VLFTSPVFLFGYLPLVLAGFFVLPRRARHAFLFFASLLFYAWTERRYVLVLIASIVLNTGLALLVERTGDRSKRRAWLVTAVVLNIGTLAYFKYFNFLLENVAWISRSLGWDTPTSAPIHLPIAISFITFEALSYVIDVYRGHTKARRNPIHVGLYVSVFPHLIAGPILRFDDIAPSLDDPRTSAERFALGARTFTIGLAKKALLANTLAKTADTLFAAPDTLTAGAAWLGIVCYALEIYFDFSGYSDMAIGLGRMFGFELPKNFDLPYSARSIKDFWRRWHISLSTWFRDYLYIPLGGNRGGDLASYRNLLIVFFLCGLWHGASWTFVIWGLYHGAFLVFERLRFGALIERLWRPLQHVYAMVVVLVGWVFFRAENLPQAWSFLSAMAGMGSADASLFFAAQVNRELLLALGIGVPVACLPLTDWFQHSVHTRVPERGLARGSYAVLSAGLHSAILVACFIALAAATNHPFIYFRF
jgi:alginate O-acetyltransferase complex protein AlgI